MNWAEVQSGPAFGFTVVGLVIVFGPLIAERPRLPGLLLFGAVIGPNMLDILPRFAGPQAVGAIGILYLIFLAGLQLDLDAFVRFRVISGGFGLLTAFIPMALGTGVAVLLDIVIGFVAALIVGKAIAAWLTGRIFGLGTAEVGLLFSMSVATGSRTCCASVLGWPGPNDIRARRVGATYSEIIAATSVPVAIAALHPSTEEGRVVLYSVARELAPGNVPTMALALELASTLCRQRELELIIGRVAPSALEIGGLAIPQTAERRDGPEDLEEWVAASTRPGDLLVLPIHDTSIGAAAIRIHASGRSVLAVSQNPETSAASVVSPMNLPVGRSLGT